MNVAMILAGGVGKRLSSITPKQFIHVMGKPILIYTLETFQQNKEIDAIQIVCLPNYQRKLWELVEEYHLTKVQWIVDSGETYQDSVIQGIKGLLNVCQEDDIVLIHFGVGAFVSEDEINDSIKVCHRNGNGIAATPCVLCLCQKDGELSSVVGIDREQMMGLASPQTFRFDLLCKMYRRAEQEHILDKIDPHTTSLMFALGIRIYFSKSSQRNIKITTREDLELFEGYVYARQKKGLKQKETGL